jgi:hypothetical protein
MANISSKPGIIRLAGMSPDTQILFEKDGDRVVKNIDEVIEACLTHDVATEMIARREMFLRQMRLLIAKLQRWCEDHKDVIKEAIFEPRYDSQMFLVVLNQTEYNPEIENELTELTIAVANDPVFSLIRFDVQTLPACEPDDVRSFIDREP